jgi:predicted amidohydrolase
MKIACAQIDCITGDKTGNLEKVGEYARRAKLDGCGMVVFPEMVDTACEKNCIRSNASPWDEGPFPMLQSIAKETGICVVCGISELVEDRLYNAVAVVGPDGQLLSRYRKVHLITTTPYEEHRIFTAGDAFCMFDFKGLKFGVMVCYDLRFPEMARHYALRGACAILMPSAWPLYRLSHWKTLIAARAIENQMYMICPNRAGKDGDLEFGGASCIVDPWGEIVAAASEAGERLVAGSVDAQIQQDVRDYMPVLKHRRPELYGID